MLSIEECGKILSSKGKKYPDEMLEEIMEILYAQARNVVEKYIKLPEDEKEAV